MWWLKLFLLEIFPCIIFCINTLVTIRLPFHPQALECQELRCWRSAGPTQALCHLGGWDKTLWHVGWVVRTLSLVSDDHNEVIQPPGCCLTSRRHHKPGATTPKAQLHMKGDKDAKMKTQMCSSTLQHHKPFWWVVVGWLEGAISGVVRGASDYYSHCRRPEKSKKVSYHNCHPTENYVFFQCIARFFTRRPYKVENLTMASTYTYFIKLWLACDKFSSFLWTP